MQYPIQLDIRATTRALAGKLQEPTGQELQEPTGQELQKPTGQELQKPTGQELQEPTGKLQETTGKSSKTGQGVSSISKILRS